MGLHLFIFTLFAMLLFPKRKVCDYFCRPVVQNFASLTVSLRPQLFSPAENKFDLELSSKVFFFTESCSVDIAFEESE